MFLSYFKQESKYSSCFNLQKTLYVYLKCLDTENLNPYFFQKYGEKGEITFSILVTFDINFHANFGTGLIKKKIMDNKNQCQ